MKKFLVLAVLILASAAVVFAQAMPGWESPQSAATQGRYRSAADNFIRPDAHTGVSFDKFYAMTSFANPGRAQLGYAAKIGGLYLGLAYGGSFWAGYTPLNYTEDKASWPGGSDKTFKTYDSIDFGSGTPENRFAILLGGGDMGFRFTFSSVGHELISLKDDFAVASSGYYKSYEAERGAITPQLAWSMTKGLTGNGIQPWATLDLGFVKNYSKAEIYDNTGKSNGVNVRYSANYVEPKLSLGLGGLIVYKNDSNFRVTADLDYDLLLRLYENEYSYVDSSGDYKTKKIKGDFNGTTFTEKTYHDHLITPSLAAQWSGGPLAVRLKLNLGVPLTGAENTVVTLKTDGSGDFADGSKKASSFTVGFNPNLRLAAQWKIHPKFTLNAGGRINFYTGSQTTATIEDNDNYKKVTEPTGRTNNILNAGLTFLPTDNLTFEVSTGIINGNINVFDTNPGGLLNFTNFLVGLKF